MPSKSKSQQRFMGAVHNCKKNGKCGSKKVKDAAESMTLKEIEKYLKLKSKNVPEKVSKAQSDYQAIVKIANDLDSLGQTKLADELDQILVQLTTNNN